VVNSNKNTGYFVLDKEYKFTLNAIPRGRILNHTIQNSCNMPYNTIVIDHNGNCLLCICDGWLPIPVGNVLDFESIEDVFNSDIAKILQKDVDDKKFTWCAINNCGIRHGDILRKNYNIIINIDESCNLACPSCRRDAIMHTTGEMFNTKIKQVERVVEWLKNFKHPVTISTSGSGDPLASLIMRPLVKNWTPSSTQAFEIKTNGLLIKKQLNGTNIFNSVDRFVISIDAGSKEVYEKVRVGGKWEVLLENLEYLYNKNKNKNVSLNFALQKSNYKDVQNFVLLCEKYKFSGFIHQLDNWGTWSDTVPLHPDNWTIRNGYFFDHNVLDPSHENHNDCKYILQNLQSEYVKIAPAVLSAIGK
jgi:MoaA/NifB/PqqE/SkfB family radical SAM enzyme